MRTGVIIGTCFIAALIVGGEVEQGAFDIFGVICAAWIVLVAIANIRKRTERGHEQSMCNLTRIIKHSLMVAQTDLRVKEDYR